MPIARSSVSNVKTSPTAPPSVRGMSFPSNNTPNSDIRLVWDGANLLPRLSHTAIWRVKYVQQSGYYAVAWHSPNGGPGTWDSGVYSFGTHPHPCDGTLVPGGSGQRANGTGSGGIVHYEEIAGVGSALDIIATPNPPGPQDVFLVTKDVWYLQARTCKDLGGGVIRHIFYPDLENNPTKLIQFDIASVGNGGANPAFYFGASDWQSNSPSAGQNDETISGTLRGIALFNDALSVSDIIAEAASPYNTPVTTAGQASVWYINKNPIPTDIADKSGAGHTPTWANSNRPAAWSSTDVFPLQVHSSGRYLQQADGTPFLMVGDSPWSLASQLTNAQITSFLADRQSKGCTAILIEAVSRAWAANAPNNIDGVAPFTVMSPVNWVLNNTYWNRVDHIVNECLSRGIAVILNPAYHGVGDGWINDYSGASDATLQAYGAALANRYTQGNVIWCMGGDHAGDNGATGNYGSGTTPNRTKQWQIVLGIRSVRTTDLITGHTSRNGAAGAVNGEAYAAWTTGYTGFNLSNVYGHVSPVDDVWSLSATAWGRAGPFPFLMIEAGYESVGDSVVTMMVPAIQGILSGSLCGAFGGHDALWHFGSGSPSGTPTSIIASYQTPSWHEMGYLGAMLKRHQWWKLEPKTDASLVTTSLGTGEARICPARASDGSFAMVWTYSTLNFSVSLATLTPGNVRARWWDYNTDTYSAASGSPFTNSGQTIAFTAPSNSRILVLDAAP